MSSHKTFRIKMKLAKKARQNIPQWIRMRTDNKIRFNAKRRHWRRTKLKLKPLPEAETGGRHSDYPSLSDLGRSFRARRRSPSTFTDDDGNAISGSQLRRFLRKRLSGRFAQAPSSEEAIADFLAEVTPLEFDKWDQLFLADISRDQIAAAIHRLPNGRASGWDGLPCDLRGFSTPLGLERILGRGIVVTYADDIVPFIRDNAPFELVPLIFEEFCMPSGVAVNFTKSCGLWCNSWKHRTDSPLGISWTSESLTVLGCTITTRNAVASQASRLMGLLERAIARWSPFTRGLSLVGRARAANSLVLGSILHHLHCYLPTEITIGLLQARLVLLREDRAMLE
ncbi:RPL39 [Cordylochernes scorpioides]|uniref:Large ribosomal subunit protein eL39 n=1 Tax=Cordylochernes scorpioides TaxID=51811 RepID=A0ABY6K8L4_9ARAC|nr:RPL39 [Cordylochernes scorpioides]